MCRELWQCVVGVCVFVKCLYCWFWSMVTEGRNGRISQEEHTKLKQN